MKRKSLVVVIGLIGTLTACGGNSSKPDKAAPPVSTSSSSGGQASVSSVNSSQSSSTSSSCALINQVEGYASLDGGVTGGANQGDGSHTLTVTTGQALNAALIENHATYKDKPLTIYIEGKINFDNTQANEIRVRRKNVSLIGRNGGEITGVGIRVSHGAENIIIRNLKIYKVPQSRGAGDLISLEGNSGAISNIWIDHNELFNDLDADITNFNCGDKSVSDCKKDYYDELVSGRGEVKNVTISYNYLHDSWKTSLWGSSDNQEQEDKGRNITFHHNYWHNVNSRLPLFRFGEAHIYNNYYKEIAGSTINSRMGAEIRVENNVFEKVKNPILSADSTAIGYWNASGNIFTQVTWGETSAERTSQCNTAPCYAYPGNTATTAFTPSYSYQVDSAETVVEKVTTYAGVDKINACLFD